MSKVLYEVLCEWDIGLAGELYSSEEEAKAAAETALEQQDFDGDDDYSFDTLEDEGLITIQERNLR